MREPSAAGSLDAHHWALKGFLAWTGEQNLTSPAAFTRATLGDYQLHHPFSLQKIIG